MVFQSDEADSAESYRKGDWAGMKLFAYPPAAGACADNRTLDFTLFRDAVTGIAVQDTCFMKMSWPLFANNLSSDILLDRDVRVPEGRRVDFRAPTRFVMTANSSNYDHAEGETGLVDIVVNGTWVNRRPGSPATPLPTDYVWFESTAMDSANGDDWGSFLVAGSGMAHIEDSDLGFAVRPVYFADADSAVVLESKIHHYNEVGILDWGSDSRIEDSEIDPGEGLSEEDESNSGIHLIGSAAQVLGNTIGQHHDYGVWWNGSQSFCTSSIGPTDAKVLTIDGNFFDGDDESENITGSAGLYVEFMCHYYQAAIEDNSFAQWKGRAMHFHQSADVDVGCNDVTDNRVGIRYFRDNTKLSTSEGNVWFKQNEFKDSEAQNGAIDDVVGLMLYDRANSGARAEKNSFKKDSGSDWNLNLTYQHDTDLDVGGSSWLSTSGTVLTDSVTIMTTINKGIGDVFLSPIRSSESLCTSGTAQGHGPGGTLEDLATEFDILHSDSTDEVPTDWRMRFAGSHPTRDAVGRVDFDVPAKALRSSVRIAIFDVQGRLIRELVDDIFQPGRFGVTWNGRGQGGERVAAGVYFLRMDAGDFGQTRKIVVLR